MAPQTRRKVFLPDRAFNANCSVSYVELLICARRNHNMSFATLQTQGLFAEAARLKKNPHQCFFVREMCRFQRKRELSKF